MKVQVLQRIAVEKLLKNLKLIYEKLPEKNRNSIIEELLENISPEVFLDVMWENGEEILNSLFNNKRTEFLAFMILDIFNKSISKSTKNIERLNMLREKIERYVAIIFENELNNEEKCYSIDEMEILFACNTNKNFLIKKVVEKNKNVRSVCVEVQNKVDTNWYKELTEEQSDEEIYKIYKELRAEGIIWLDPKEENIGRLLKENTTHHYDREGREIQPEDKSIGFYGKKQERILQKGDLVILDTDFLVRKEDIEKSLRLQICYFRDRFCRRYIEEINREHQYTK